MSAATANAEWSALVERPGERELIGDALRSSKLGHGCFVILYGPAGIGRSSLLRASVLAAGRRGIAVIEACGTSWNGDTDSGSCGSSWRPRSQG